MKLAKKMATHMTEKLNCDGFNLVQNNGEALIRALWGMEEENA